jgi:hypothetical protein
MTTPARYDVEWRVARWGRRTTVALSVGGSAFIVLDSLGQPRSTWPGVAALVLGINVLALVLAIRPRIRIAGDELVVVNPLWTRRMSRVRVEKARPGYSGIEIRLA